MISHILHYNDGMLILTLSLHFNTSIRTDSTPPLSDRGATNEESIPNSYFHHGGLRPSYWFTPSCFSHPSTLTSKNLPFASLPLPCTISRTALAPVSTGKSALEPPRPVCSHYNPEVRLITLRIKLAHDDMGIRLLTPGLMAMKVNPSFL